MHCAQNQLHRRRVSAHAVFVYAHSSVGAFSFSLKTMTHLRQVFVSTVPLAAMRCGCYRLLGRKKRTQSGCCLLKLFRHREHQQSPRCDAAQTYCSPGQERRRTKVSSTLAAATRKHLTEYMTSVHFLHPQYEYFRTCTLFLIFFKI